MSLNDLPSIKIILLGDSGVGKSSIIKRYLEDKFDQNIAVTFGSNFLEKVLTIKGKNRIMGYSRARRISFGD